MVVRTSLLLSAARLASKADRPRPWYVFAVASLAAFFVGYAVMHPPVQGYVASAIIEYKPSLAKEGADEEFARLAEQGVTARPHTQLPGVYRLSSVNADRESAVPTLMLAIQDLASRAAQRENETHVEQRRRLAARVTQAEHVEQRTRRQLEEAEERLAQATRSPSLESSIPSYAPGAGGPAASSNRNPEWVELTQLLEQLQAERARLLIDRLPAHPAVVDVEMRIAAIEQRLAGMPRTLATAPSAASTSAMFNRTPTVPATEGDVAMLTAEVAQRKEAWRKAVEDLSAARAEQQKAETAHDTAGAVVRIVEPAALRAIAGGRFSLGVLVVLASLSMGVGAGLAWAVAPGRTPALLETAEDVIRILQTPVIATLSIGSGAGIPFSHRVTTLLTKFGVRATETTLLAAVSLFVVATATDSLVAQVAAQDPFQALSLVFEGFRLF